MITDKIENLHKYKAIFPYITDLMNILNSKNLIDIIQRETIGVISLIPIKSEKVTENFDKNVLEAHKAQMDIHITLDGHDVIGYANLDDEAKIFKNYDEINDYLLANSKMIKTITVPKNYFCIIPNNFAHMALYEGHSNIKKIVVKMPVEN